uniref:CCA tRNA nucleotidyltransferase n=1 Tax=Geobacter metallireducens TaxID=28232 RepID=A0A831U704_GEOME
MTASIALFMETPPLTTLRRVAAGLGLQGYVVGGCLRDLLLGREVNDVDIAVAGDTEAFPRQFARECGGTVFWLDRERGHSRVVIKVGGESATFDFAPLRGKDIVVDLALRDFTINALAVPLQGEPGLIDPLGGAADIRAKVVRRCSASAFRDDPLRLVRSFRFAATLGFRIDSATLAVIPDLAPLLATIAGERIRDELFRILQVPEAGSFFRLMGDGGLLEVLFGLLPSRITPAAEAIDRVEEVVRSLSRLGDEAAAEGDIRLREEIQGGITVQSLMKLAAFLDAAEMAPNGATDRLRLGKAAGQLVERLCRACSFPQADHCDDVSAYRFFNDCDPAGLEIPLLLLARGRLAESPCRELASYYLRRHIPRGGNLLLTGGEIMELLSIPPGRIVGEAQELLREAQCTGEVRTDAEARAFLRKKMLTTEEPMR